MGEKGEAGKLDHATSPGRPRLIEGEAEQLLEAQVAACNDATPEEHCEAWKLNGQPKVSRATMQRSLERLKLSRKRDHPSH